MWWSSKIHIIWYICLSLGKRTQRAVNAARTRLGAHYLKIFAPSHLSLPLILSHDFMLILCWFQLRSAICHKTSQCRSAVPYILSLFPPEFVKCAWLISLPMAGSMSANQQNIQRANCVQCRWWRFASFALLVFFFLSESSFMFINCSFLFRLLD